ncbi:hypothetical protein ERO13_A01G122150v2 [Gossypium hirsutum]|uniref:Protein FAR1-RELATED SEQUENCE n=1 Tax=Gossypium tomentosum TaxID=34277 RepID=A0A5D2RRH1_GOSTO|nr:hypothetical protein ERO13_A01G122150v2 [Gossypium hirsutum]TYI43073.1 hypothetical protein ES332_A01G143500v1 [Gossypium tomentosum]
MNKYFKDFLNSSTLMSKFVIQYDKTLNSRYNKEREKNFKIMNSKTILKTLYSMEKEALEAYTRKIFRKFQDEMHKFVKEELEYIVTFIRSSTTTTCSCHMFEFLGIMYRHELIILIKKGLHSL